MHPLCSLMLIATCHCHLALSPGNSRLNCRRGLLVFQQVGFGRLFKGVLPCMSITASMVELPS
jgi:hypothetical protein